MKSNDTYLNILISFAYAGRNQKFNDLVTSESEKGNVNLMVDSGAFTLFNSKKKLDWLTLDNYCKYIDANNHKIEKYVMLDVIGNDHASKNNYETMVQRGYNPMFVFTMADTNFNYLKDARKNNEHICVAGGVTTKGDWTLKRIQDVYKITQGKLHGLGFVAYPKMYQLPLHSVDSSSWVQSSQVYGNLSYFDNGIKALSYKDVLTRKKRLPIKMQEVLEQLKITPKMFSNIENHKGAKSIATITNTLSYIEYQKYSKRLGVNLFLAIANTGQANTILYINEKLKKGTLTYEQFKRI